MSRLEKLGPEEQRRLLALAELELAAEREGRGGDPVWAAIARVDQIPPPGDWRAWLILAGRGWGKTRTGAETIAGWVRGGTARRVAVVAPTQADLRSLVMPTLQRAAGPGTAYTEAQHFSLRWPGGAVAMGFSADDPDSLRGYEFDAAWCDELAAWRYPDAFDQLSFGLRLGPARVVVTTTPRPVRLVRELLADPRTVVTRGRTLDNAANLSPSAVRDLLARYGGTRLGRQELDAEVLDDVPGALWTRDTLDACRVARAPELVRVVVAVDPAMSADEGSDETGILVVGKGVDGHGYVLADLSLRASPDGWARAAVDAFRLHHADRLIAEANQGGDLVESTIRTVDPGIAYRAVRASRGKRTRAEPVAALYEQRRVHHVGAFPALEDQQCAALPDGGQGPDDRLDALVWALTELNLAGSPWDNPAAIPFSLGVWPCPCGHMFGWEPNRACPRCGRRAAASYDEPIVQLDVPDTG